MMKHFFKVIKKVDGEIDLQLEHQMKSQKAQILRKKNLGILKIKKIKRTKKNQLKDLVMIILKKIMKQSAQSEKNI